MRPVSPHDVNKIAGVKADVDDILSGDATGLCSREGLPGFGSLDGGNEGHRLFFQNPQAAVPCSKMLHLQCQRIGHLSMRWRNSNVHFTPAGEKSSTPLPLRARGTICSITTWPKPRRGGGMTGGPPFSHQWIRTLSSVSLTCHRISTSPCGPDNARCFEALVASSCKSRPKCCTASGFRMIGGPPASILPALVSPKGRICFHGSRPVPNLSRHRPSLHLFPISHQGFEMKPLPHDGCGVDCG